MKEKNEELEKAKTTICDISVISSNKLADNSRISEAIANFTASGKIFRGDKETKLENLAVFFVNKALRENDHESLQKIYEFLA